MSFGIPVRNGLMLGLTASTALSTRGGFPVPALSLNFLSGTLDSRITFSRGTNATLTDSTGRLTYAPNNLVQRSQELQDVYWIKLAVTATGDVTTAPDGTTTADKVVATASAFTRRLLYANATLSASTNIFSFYAKASEYSLVRTVDSAGGSRWFASFDLSNGTLVGGTTGGAQFVSAGISDAGNGWYRCWVVFNAAAGAGAIGMVGYPAGATLDQFGVQYAGDGTSGTFFWGLQLEQVTYQTTPSAYAVTTSALYYGPRFDYDPVTLQPRGLLVEEQRANLLTYSDQFNDASWIKNNSTVTANATTSPDGTANADKLNETAVTSFFNVSRTPTLAISTTHTLSCYMKAAERTFGVLNIFTGAASCWTWYNLSTGVVSTLGAGATATITPAGNGWYRCTLTIATAATGSPNIAIFPAVSNGVLSYAGAAGSGIFIYGAQLEAGAFATSYIPTVASTVTRNADVATMTGANFSTWYNQSEGTFVSEASKYAASDGYIFTADAGAAANLIGGGILASGAGFSSINASGVAQAFQTIGTTTPNSVFKLAVAAATNNANVALNGATATTDTTVTMPVVDRLQLGSYVGVSTRLNGHIRTIAYFNTRLPNDRLVALSR